MNLKTWLRLSLAANAVLLVAMIWIVRPHANVSSIEPAPVAAEMLPEAATPPNSPATIASDNSPAPPASGDFLSSLAALRAAGISDRILAKVVVADFDERWEQQQQEMQARYERGEVESDAFEALARERELEQEKELRTVLGDAGFRNWDLTQSLQALNLNGTSLSATETNALYELRKELQARLRALEQARQQGEIDDAEYSAQSNAAQQAHETKLKALLGNERFARMQTPDATPNRELQRSLHNVNASEAQVESMLKTQRNWLAQRAEIERQMPGSSENLPVLEEKLRALDAARDQEYQRVLGPSEFEALQRKQDYRYVTMERFANAWSLDTSRMDEIYRSIRYYEKSVQDYEDEARALAGRGETVNWDEINQNRRHFAQQNEQALRTYLGAELYSKLQKNHVLPCTPSE